MIPWSSLYRYGHHHYRLWGHRFGSYSYFYYIHIYVPVHSHVQVIWNRPSPCREPNYPCKLLQPLQRAKDIDCYTCYTIMGVVTYTYQVNCK
jgi:hypothetical protein